MKDREKTEMKGGGSFLSDGRRRISNLRLVPPSNQDQDSVAIECQKCGTWSIGGRCPACMIPLVDKNGVMKNGKLVRLDDFRKKTAKVYQFPVAARPQSQNNLWICGNCHEENYGDTCWRCERARPVF